MEKDGFARGEWIVYYRLRYLSGYLPADRVERLEALGMVWDTGSILWEKSYAAAVQYYLENHTLEIPVKYVTPDGMALGVSNNTIRRQWRMKGVVVGAAANKAQVQYFARSEYWEPQPGQVALRSNDGEV